MSNTTVFFTGALEVLIEMKKQDIPFNKETYLLAFAICYKLVSTSNSQDKNILEIPSLCLPFFFLILKFLCVPSHDLLLSANILDIFKSCIASLCMTGCTYIASHTN